MDPFAQTIAGITQNMESNFLQLYGVLFLKVGPNITQADIREYLLLSQSEQLANYRFTLDPKVANLLSTSLGT